MGASSIDKAKKLVDDKKVSITLADTPLKLYIKANVTGTYKGVEHTASTVIKDNHDSIVSVELDGVSVFSTGNAEGAGICNISSAEKTTLDYKLSVKEILEFVRSVNINDIDFILDSVKLNKALADEGLRADYGLKVGRTILSAEHNSIFGDSVMTYAMAATAASTILPL